MWRDTTFLKPLASALPGETNPKHRSKYKLMQCCALDFFRETRNICIYKRIKIFITEFCVMANNCKSETIQLYLEHKTCSTSIDIKKIGFLILGVEKLFRFRDECKACIKAIWDIFRRSLVHCKRL